MKPQSIDSKKRSPYWLVLLVFLLSILSCSKKESAVEEPQDEYSYEVTCESCEIKYTDQSNNTKTFWHDRGVWRYRFERTVSFELKLSIKTTLSTQQSLKAYVRKNTEIVFGNTGYKQATLSYDTQRATGTQSFGTYQSTAPSNGGGSNGGGTSTSTSTVCGPKNKTGGYCKRTVSGGGRCWQHR